MLLQQKKMQKRRRGPHQAPAVAPVTRRAPQSRPLRAKSQKKNPRSGKRRQRSKKRNRRRTRRSTSFIFTYSLCCVNGTKCLATDPQNLYRSEAESAEEKEQDELVTSTVRPEEIPPIPENRFLMRISPQIAQKPKEEVNKDQRNKDERPRERCV